MDGNNYLKCILKGIIGTLLFSLIGIVILSFIMSKAVFSKQIFNLIYIIISLVSLAFGSMIAAKKKKSKGMLVGIGVAMLYIIVIYLFCTLFSGGFKFSSFEVIRFIAILIVGALGGVFGVNMGDE